MTSSPNLKLTIEFNDPELDPVKRDEQAKRLIAELKSLDDIDVDRVDANLAEGTKSIGGTLVGLLTAEVSLANGKKLMGFLGDRLGGKPIEFTVEVNGKKLTAKASSREELDYAIAKANDFIEKWQ
jgi:hypothetical protein